MNSERCVLGEVVFDPVEAQDFRLSVEGTSGTGKTNTLAVILKNLAPPTYPRSSWSDWAP
jgi:ABC-type transporter Mla maintaining outer membrane lipid asymmetry ATPase subunit MlaF